MPGTPNPVLHVAHRTAAAAPRGSTGFAAMVPKGGGAPPGNTDFSILRAQRPLSLAPSGASYKAPQPHTDDLRQALPVRAPARKAGRNAAVPSRDPIPPDVVARPPAICCGCRTAPANPLHSLPPRTIVAYTAPALVAASNTSHAPLCDIPSGCGFPTGPLDTHLFFPSRAASGRCVLSAAAAGVPAGVVSALEGSSSWRTGGCAGCCGGRFLVFAAHSPPRSGRPPPASLCFRGHEVRRVAVSSRGPGQSPVLPFATPPPSDVHHWQILISPEPSTVFHKVPAPLTVSKWVLNPESGCTRTAHPQRVGALLMRRALGHKH